MIPLYILGLLLRFGPQHGYQIKKLIAEQLEDFTQIKLPTVYYHLEKMEAAGLILANRDKQGARPEKTVYQVNKAGEDKFKELLHQSLQINYITARSLTLMVPFIFLTRLTTTPCWTVSNNTSPT